MWIKICANTNLDDAKLAAELGADAVGFVFAPSVRRVTAAEVSRITPHLPDSVERVGVFASHTAEEIAQTVKEAGLDAVQLHGGISLVLLRQLHKMFDGKVKLIQTVHWQVGDDAASSPIVRRHLKEVAAEGLVDRVLIDSNVGSANGGTGVPFDWIAARSTLEEGATGLKLVLAGGLRQENVGDAIQRLNLWGVDVASGVEEKQGKKSPEKLAAFIRAARDASVSVR